MQEKVLGNGVYLLVHICIYIYIVYMLIEHVHHQLFHIHTYADISFAADTIAAFLSRAQT